MLEALMPTEPSELEDWKRALRADVERWLASVDEIPSSEDDTEVHEVPDLLSFHEALAAVSTETRKANRRTAEAFGQWSETVRGLDEQLLLLREQLSSQPPVSGDALPRSWCLALAEVNDRLRRVAAAFASAPAPRRRAWLADDGALRAAWHTQHQAFDILVGHMGALLSSAGLTRVETMHRAFDPRTMTAVAAVADSRWAAQTVLEEIAPGYLLHGELLRVAQVKVSAKAGAEL